MDTLVPLKQIFDDVCRKYVHYAYTFYISSNQSSLKIIVQMSIDMQMLQFIGLVISLHRHYKEDKPVTSHEFCDHCLLYKQLQTYQPLESIKIRYLK